jgi:apolipoprotein D and lipocalin family protein
MRLAAWALVFGVLGGAGAAMAQPLPREPQKTVDLSRYAGKWYEQGRFDQSFQRGCEGVTAEYSRLPDGRIKVLNTCRQDRVDGPARSAEAKARVVEGTGNAKLRVSFFWPFEGDYWVLDRAPDYSWAIVGEGSGQYLWLLTRARQISPAQYSALVRRAARFGYDTTPLRRTRQ